jgi:hypothetical protein
MRWPDCVARSSRLGQASWRTVANSVTAPVGAFVERMLAQARPHFARAPQWKNSPVHLVEIALQSSTSPDDESARASRRNTFRACRVRVIRTTLRALIGRRLLPRQRPCPCPPEYRDVPGADMAKHGSSSRVAGSIALVASIRMTVARCSGANVDCRHESKQSRFQRDFDFQR